MLGDELQLSNLLLFNNKFYKGRIVWKGNKVSVSRTDTSIIVFVCHIHYKYDKTSNALENIK